MFRSRCTLAFALAAITCLGTGLTTGQSKRSARTLTLDDPSKRPSASIQDMAWLSGHWRGKGFGGIVEEAWTPPLGKSMMGMFRFLRDGQLSFMEIVMLKEEAGSLVLKVKHFTSEFVAWEDKEGSIDFPLVRLEPRKAYFNGLTIEMPDDNSLDIYLAMKHKDGTRTEEALRFKRYTE